MSNNDPRKKHTNIIQYAVLSIYKEKTANARIGSEKDKAKITRLLYLLNNLHNVKEIDESINKFIKTTLGINQTPFREEQLDINIPHAYAIAVSILYIVSKR